jgi:hypothetical protein
MFPKRVFRNIDGYSLLSMKMSACWRTVIPTFCTAPITSPSVVWHGQGVLTRRTRTLSEMVIDQPACGDENWDEWVPLSDVLATVAKSEADVIAGRTFGEDEIRAAYRVPRRPS